MIVTIVAILFVKFLITFSFQAYLLKDLQARLKTHHRATSPTLLISLESANNLEEKLKSLQLQPQDLFEIEYERVLNKQKHFSAQKIDKLRDTLTNRKVMHVSVVKPQPSILQLTPQKIESASILNANVSPVPKAKQTAVPRSLDFMQSTPKPIAKQFVPPAAPPSTPAETGKGLFSFSKPVAVFGTSENLDAGQNIFEKPANFDFAKQLSGKSPEKPVVGSVNGVGSAFVSTSQPSAPLFGKPASSFFAGTTVPAFKTVPGNAGAKGVFAFGKAEGAVASTVATSSNVPTTTAPAVFTSKPLDGLFASANLFSGISSAPSVTTSSSSVLPEKPEPKSAVFPSAKQTNLFATTTSSDKPSMLFSFSTVKTSKDQSVPSATVSSTGQPTTAAFSFTSPTTDTKTGSFFGSTPTFSTTTTSSLASTFNFGTAIAKATTQTTSSNFPTVVTQQPPLGLFSSLASVSEAAAPPPLVSIAPSVVSSSFSQAATPSTVSQAATPSTVSEAATPLATNTLKTVSLSSSLGSSTGFVSITSVISSVPFSTQAPVFGTSTSSSVKAPVSSSAEIVIPSVAVPAKPSEPAAPTPAATVATTTSLAAPLNLTQQPAPPAFSFVSSAENSGLQLTSAQGSIFATTTPETVGSVFESKTTQSVFGAPISSAAVTATGMFGAVAMAPSSGLFGSALTSPSTTTSSPGTFASPTVTTAATSPTSFFGNLTSTATTTSSTSFFGTTMGTPLMFATASTTTSASPFAAQPVFAGATKSTATTTSSSIFGAPAAFGGTPTPAPAFGATGAFGAAATSAAPAFGQAASFGSLFASSASSGTTNSVFGSGQTTSSFGASGGSIFGNTATTTTPFGSPTVSSSSFGSGAFGGTTPVTTVSTAFGFTKPTSSFGFADSKDAASSFSFASLNVATTTASSTGFGSSFGQPQAQNPFTQGKPLFGGSPSGTSSGSIFGSTASAFGSPAQTSTFGSPPTFAQQSTFGQSSFGGSAFGGSSPAGPFSGGGQTVGQTGFGAASAGSFQKSPGFGGPPVFGSTSPGAFGASPSFGGAPAFGAAPVFGAAAAAKPFGGSPTTGM